MNRYLILKEIRPISDSPWCTPLLSTAYLHLYKLISICSILSLQIAMSSVNITGHRVSVLSHLSAFPSPLQTRKGRSLMQSQLYLKPVCHSYWIPHCCHTGLINILHPSYVLYFSTGTSHAMQLFLAFSILFHQHPQSKLCMFFPGINPHCCLQIITSSLSLASTTLSHNFMMWRIHFKPV